MNRRVKSNVHLFVINQDTSFRLIKNKVLKNNYENIIILSTHKLFSFEKDEINLLLSKVNITFLNFGKFLKDDKMEELDRLAYDSISINSYNHWDSQYLFLVELNYFKNKCIYESICKDYLVKGIYYWAIPIETFNLGISFKFWQERKGVRLIPGIAYHFKKRLLSNINKISFFNNLAKFTLNLIQKMKRRTFFLIKEGNNIFVFSSLRRLEINQEVEVDTIQYNPWCFLSIKNNTKEVLFNRFVEKINKENNLKAILSVPLHRYGDVKLFSNNPKMQLYIFEDAFRPSNYPPYYYAKLFYWGKIVVRDMFDYSFFLKSGKEVLKPLTFLKKSYFNTSQINPSKNYNVKCVILSLNHAGNWTALINRSDTDILIESFLSLAHKFKGIKFIIRLHPTMINPRAEGENSKRRIEDYIQKNGVPNIEISKANLTQDWERGDLFISEYSLSVLDVIRKGKLGFFVNLTNRRSFVQDFIDLGFLNANSYDEMELIFNGMITRPQNHLVLLKQACEKYNTQLEEFIKKNTKTFY